MNIINTTYIIEPGQLQPFTGYSLDFIQKSSLEMLYAVAQTFVGNITSSTTPYVLWGCVKTNTGGTNYSYTQGYIMFNKEIYYFPGITSINITDTDVCTITITSDTIADPLYFTNGLPHNVHDHRTIQLTNGLSGSGTFNFSNCVYIQTVKIAQQIALASQTTASTSYIDLSGLTYTTPNDGISRDYRLKLKLISSPDVPSNNNGTAIDGGAFYQIWNDTASVELDVAKHYIYFVANTTVGDMGLYDIANTSTIVAETIVNLPPNTTIKCRFHKDGGNSITVTDCKFIIEAI